MSAIHLYDPSKMLNAKIPKFGFHVECSSDDSITITQTRDIAHELHLLGNKLSGTRADLLLALRDGDNLPDWLTPCEALIEAVVEVK